MNIKETIYQSPAVDVIDICAESIICASGNSVSVTNLWEHNTEDEW